MTVAEALKLAATIESRYQGDDFHLSTEGGPYWYVPAVDYCLASGMIQKGDLPSGITDGLSPGGRRRSSLPPPRLAKAMPELNSLARVKASVPDIRSGDEGAEAIYSLYAKGILSGVDTG